MDQNVLELWWVFFVLVDVDFSLNISLKNCRIINDNNLSYIDKILVRGNTIKAISLPENLNLTLLKTNNN